MVSFPMILLVSVVLGFLAGLGVGGGSLLLLWLTQVMLMPHPQARILNLLFYLPAAGTSILFRQRRQIPWDVSITGILTGCTAAALCTLLSRHMEMDLLKKLLGCLLILTGLREIFYRPRNAR